ncbi:MAG: polysaccharide deacetylase family protein [Candidatus Rifleibacteriota bacterium]
MINYSIPVLYYHRVGAPDPAHLSVATELFEKQLGYIQRAGYQTLSMHDLIDYLAGQNTLTRPSVCITFDDGFIDNYLFAQPLLEKYKCKASLFIATSLIRPDTQKGAKKMVGFNQAHTAARNGDLSHFLSKKELKLMQNSGVWQIFSHSHSHNQVFTSRETTGTYPDSDNHWGIISAWQKNISKGKWPVFKRNAELVSRAVFPRIENQKIIFEQESQEEFQNRIKIDLITSLKIIKNLFPENYPVICWPWGKADERLENIARKVGYKAALRTDAGANLPGMNLMKIHRFPVKKSDMLRFKLGLALRKLPLLAKIYSFVRNKKLYS